jgi:hypothetical protein
MATGQAMPINLHHLNNANHLLYNKLSSFISLNVFCNEKQRVSTFLHNSPITDRRCPDTRQGDEKWHKYSKFHYVVNI